MSRLPQPGADAGSWGTILNDFLTQAHNVDGSLKDNSVPVTAIADTTITEAKLSAGVQSKLNAVSAQGATGPVGPTGATGPAGSNGATGATGPAGATTIAGISGLQTALDSKEPIITAGTTGDYLRGDKSWQTLNKGAVGLGNVDNTSDANKNSATATLSNKTLQNPAIDKINNLSANGVVTTSGGNGTLGVSTFPFDGNKYLDGFGNFTAPQAILTERGDFSINTSYTRGDIVTHEYARWYRINTGTSGLSFVPTDWIHLGLYAVGTTSDPGNGMLWIDVS